MKEKTLTKKKNNRWEGVRLWVKLGKFHPSNPETLPSLGLFLRIAH